MRCGGGAGLRHPRALRPALSVAGLPTSRFTFEGFLPQNRKNRRAQLDALREEERTMVFYEAPHKLAATLAELADVLGADRRAVLCRELTKLHEEILRLPLGALAERYRQQQPRGEFVLVVEGAAPAPEEVDLDAAQARVEQLRGQGLALKQAAAQAAREMGCSRRTLYERVLGKR